MSVDVEEVLGQMQQAVNEKLGIPLNETQATLADVVDMLNDQKVTIGGDTMTEPLFGSLRTGILNELYEAENDYLERIKEKDARIEELEAELLKQKEKGEIVIQLDTSSISEVVNKAISEVTNDLEQPNPGFIVYEGKTYRKTERDPQEGDVVIITEFDGETGAWLRKLDTGIGGNSEFYLDHKIRDEILIEIDYDEIAAVYAPFNEGTTYA